VNAPTTLGAPSWQRYRPALDMLKPGCSEEEARYRCGLMLVRDNAWRRIEADPFGGMRVVWNGAQQAALQPMPIDDLKDCWGAFGRMFLAARQLMDLSDRAGGDDARG